jgi:mxaA protein
MRLKCSANSQRKSATIAVAVTCLLLAAKTPLPATVLNTPAAKATTTATVSPSPPESSGATAPAAAREPGSGAASAHLQATPSTEAVVQQPRPFGYVLGDTLTQRILLGPAGSEFQPASLPPSERTGLWFARRSSKIEKAEDGRRWLVIDYQLVNAPQTLTTVNLPAVTLKSKEASELVVSPWLISVAPLTPRTAFAKGGLQELRPDHPAPMVPTSMLRRQLEIWVIAFAVTLASWLGWWLVRALRAAANQPFASALREVRRTGDDSAAAWLALHRAFDRTAGRALQTTTLPVLFKRAPHFERQRAAIEQFYARSNLRFFGVAPAGGATREGDRRTSAGNTAVDSRAMPADRDASQGNAAPTPDTGDAAATTSLRTLATTLRRVEKQHER